MSYIAQGRHGLVTLIDPCLLSALHHLPCKTSEISILAPVLSHIAPLPFSLAKAVQLAARSQQTCTYINV